MKPKLPLHFSIMKNIFHPYPVAVAEKFLLNDTTGRQKEKDDEILEEKYW